MVDQLVGPGYKNLLIPDQGIEAFKQLISASVNAIPDTQYTIEDSVAEGDQVVVRLNFSGTNTGSLMGSTPTGKFFSVPGLVF